MDRDPRQAAVDAGKTALDADLVPLVNDEVVTVSRGGVVESVRTLLFESDHRAQAVLAIRGDDVVSIEFSTSLPQQFDVEVCGPNAVLHSGLWTGTRPLQFGPVDGAIRFVYGRFHHSRPVRQYQTEWILVP
jgi:hypothetical protein